MAYRRVGSYQGSVPLQAIADRLAVLPGDWSPAGYVTKNAPLADAFRHGLAAVIPGDWTHSMLVALRPWGGNTPMHVDELEREGLARYHLVLQTNDRCWNFHDGDWQQLELGGVYTIDVSRNHASINWGATLRVHLVVDALGAS